MTQKRKSLLALALIVIVFCGMALFYTRPLALKAGDHTMRENGGDTLFHIYVLSWTAHSLKSNPFNLFNATMFYPNSYTLAYSDHQLMSSIIALPVLALTRNGVLAFNFVVIFSFVLSAFGAFMLVRHLTGDNLAAFAGGTIYGFAMYKLAHISHMQLLSTGFIPLALLCLHLFTERRKARYAALFSVFAVAIFLTVWSYGFYLAFAVLLYMVVLAAVKRKKILALLSGRANAGERSAALRWGAVLVASFAVIGLLVAPFIMPYLKARDLNPNFQRDIGEVYSYSADVTDFLVAPPQSLVWGSATGLLRPDPYTRGNGAERSLFAGLLPFLLTVVGLVSLRRMGRGKRFVFWFYLLLMLAAGVLCLGVTLYAFGRHADIWMPYRLMYRFFPGFKAIRTPTRIFVLVLLSLSVLSGFGVKAIRGWLEARLDRIAAVFLIVLLLLLITVEILPTGIEMKKVESRSEFPSVYRWLASRSGDAPTVVLPLAPYDPEAPSEMDDLAYVGMEPHRIYRNTASWKKLLNGYSGYTPVSYKDAVKLTGDFPSTSSLSFLRRLGIRYVILEGDRYDDRVFEELLEKVAGEPALIPAYRDGEYYAFRLR